MYIVFIKSYDTKDLMTKLQETELEVDYVSREKAFRLNSISVKDRLY